MSLPSVPTCATCRHWLADPGAQIAPCDAFDLEPSRQTRSDADVLIEDDSAYGALTGRSYACQNWDEKANDQFSRQA